MLKQLRISLVCLLILTLLTGVVYPLTVTALAAFAFPKQAEGSLIRQGDRLVGSELVGQSFTKSHYFWSRLSATGAIPYDGAASGGSNYGPMNPKLKEAAARRVAALHATGVKGPIPVDLATASGSGLDPHISPASAEIQVPRVAAARKLSEDRVRRFVAEATQGRQFGLLGEPRVNVLILNLLLDQTRTGDE